ncbi:MAG: PIN domain-containing protein [Desulfobacterales bacterium]|nr:PIN domain-containing protein [Desulfobacterales bacterium]
MILLFGSIFFAARSSSHVVALENLIINRKDICICGIVLTEVLQGIRRNSEFKKTKDLFNNLLFLPMPYSVFLNAAEIYRSLHRKGITFRKSVDCMIASVAIENDIPLLHNDKDFKAIEKHCDRKCYNLKQSP